MMHGDRNQSQGDASKDNEPNQERGASRRDFLKIFGGAFAAFMGASNAMPTPVQPTLASMKLDLTGLRAQIPAMLRVNAAATAIRPLTAAITEIQAHSTASNPYDKLVKIAATVGKIKADTETLPLVTEMLEATFKSAANADASLLFPVNFFRDQEPTQACISRVLADAQQQKWLSVINSPELEIVIRFQQAWIKDDRLVVGGISPDVLKNLQTAGFNFRSLELAEAQRGISKEFLPSVKLLVQSLAETENYLLGSKQIGELPKFLINALAVPLESIFSCRSLQPSPLLGSYMQRAENFIHGVAS